MPDLTPDTIATAAASPASVTVDGNSAAAVPIDKQIDALNLAKITAAATGTNRQGGPRSGWGMMRPARSITEGA